MDNVFQLNDVFNFDLLELQHPTGLQGGGYFTRLNLDDKPLYIQLNRCKTKNGIIKTNKKQYLDLMFDNTNEKTISWFESLQNKCQQIIYNKRNLWFHNDLEYDDIESNFVSPLRIFKSGKYYVVRCKIPAFDNNNTSLNCYDVNNNPLDNNKLNDTSQLIIPLIEVQGIRFTSRDFSFEFVVKQVMIIDSLDFNKQCMIKQQSLGNCAYQTNDVAHINNKMPVQAQEQNNSDTLLEEDASDNITLHENSDLNKNKLLEESPEQQLEESPEQQLEESPEQQLEKSPEQQLEESPEQQLEESPEQQLEESPEQQLEAVTEITLDSKIDSEYLNYDKNKLDTLDINFEDLGNDTVKLKDREEVYYDIWYEARNRAKLAREEAIKAYLEAKNIKNFYMIDECSDIESDENEEYNLEK